MPLRVLPVTSSKTRDILLEVHDEDGHCTVFELDDLRDLGRPAGSKVIYDNFEITPDAEKRLLAQGRQAAADYAARLRLL